MKTVLIAGGTGNIGKRLVQLLHLKGYKVIVLTRDIKSADKNALCDYSEWSPEKYKIDNGVLERADYIINLAGAGIADKRWTSRRKKIIEESRVNSCKSIVKALWEVENNVKAVISASAIGFYGPDNGSNNGFEEDAPAANDFLGRTCKKWEQAIAPVRKMNKRLVILRTGLVLDRDYGIYKELKKALLFRIAPVLGKGTQKFSWLHMDDICGAYIKAIEKEEMQGVYNACVPSPVTIKELALNAAQHKYGKYFIVMKIPALPLKLVLGEMAESMLLNGTTANAQKLLDSAFTFKFLSIKNAIENISNPC